MISKDLRLREADGKFFVVAVGEKSKSFHIMVKLNSTAAQIFTMLQNKEENIPQKISELYGIGIDNAREDFEKTLIQFEKAGFFQ